MAPAESVWATYNSSYLHMLARIGVIGLGAFLWLSLGCASKAWSGMKRPGLPRQWHGAVTGLLGGFIGAQVGMLTNPFYQLPGGGMNLWLGLGLAFAITRTATGVPSGSSEQERETTCANAGARPPVGRRARTGGAR